MTRGERRRPARGGRGAARSRRRFLKLLAAGSAGVLAAGPGGALAASRPAAARAPKDTLPRAVRDEIESQKAHVARMLKTIREHPLPTGSEMAFAFTPMKAAPRAGPTGPRGDERRRR